MTTKWPTLVGATVLAIATTCTTPTTQKTTTTTSIGPVLYVNRDRANVGDSDDIHGSFIEIERTSPDSPACVHFRRTTPEGDTYTQLALLAEAPDDVGIDYFRIGDMTVRSGDLIRGDGELGSAERPPLLAQAHSDARAQLIEACAPLNLDQRFDQVFDTAPIIFIEHVEPQQ